MRRNLIRLASGSSISFRLAKFGWVVYMYADLRVKSLTAKQNTEIKEGARKLRSYFNPMWTKVREILGQCRRPLVLAKAFADCLCHV